MLFHPHFHQEWLVWPEHLKNLLVKSEECMQDFYSFCAEVCINTSLVTDHRDRHNYKLFRRLGS